MGDLQRTLMPIFLEEASANLGDILRFFKSFQTHPQGDPVALEEACRGAHTLKGTGGLVRLPRVQELAAALESGLNQVRDSARPLSRKDGNALLALFKELTALVKEVRASQAPDSSQAAPSPIAPPSAPQAAPVIAAPVVAAPVAPEMAPSAAAAEPPEPVAEDVCCRFRAGAQEYYLPIEQMSEIALLQATIALPLAPGYLKGLMTLRGEVIPVVDLASLHNHSAPAHTKQHLVISRSRGEQIAFLTEGLPQLSAEYGGVRLDVQDFIASHGVKTA